ncbi:hypothetical protein ACN28S_19635 [Cystobacter fuscus]
MSGIGIDEVFTAGNGTTCAVTRFSTHPAGAPDLAARVELDIRHALGHHGVAWEGTTEGLVGGKEPSRVQAFQRVGSAYEQILGEQCPALAVGGGTEAKGNPHLIATAALFTSQLGPPINESAAASPEPGGAPGFALPPRLAARQ